MVAKAVSPATLSNPATSIYVNRERGPPRTAAVITARVLLRGGDMTKLASLSALVFCVTVGVRTASAAVCVQVDTSRDTLSEQDRNATAFFLAQTLQQQGLQVVQQDCQGTYVVYHVRLGSSVTVFMQGPQGYRQATARALEEVPAVYSQMVHSLITGQPMNTANDTVDRTNVTAAQQAPNRVEADSLWYARLGYGANIGPSFTSGPAFGFGYRYELDSLGIDFSFFDTAVYSKGGNSDASGANITWVKLMALYFLNPTANRSSYVGAGLGWGFSTLQRSGSADTFAANDYTGSGLQGELTAGYEFLRASTIRMFVQADATLPFYLVRTTDYLPTGGTTSTQTAYAPSLTVSFGLGWGGRSVTRVHVVD